MKEKYNAAPHFADSVTVVVAIPVRADQLAHILAQTRVYFDGLKVITACIVLSHPDASIQTAAQQEKCRFVEIVNGAFGRALTAAMALADTTHVLTIDGDVEPAADLFESLWSRRQQADVVVASRYVSGGQSITGPIRRTFSRLGNIVFGRGLSLNVRDMSSGIRLYRRSGLRPDSYVEPGYSVLQEILIHLLAEGDKVLEVPYRYEPFAAGQSSGFHINLAGEYLKTFIRMWRLRNSIKSADYDDRAHDSIIPLQRYWQRMRYKHVVALISGEGPVLDVGCGSSRIIGALPAGSIALDVLLRKVRYARKFGRMLVNGSGFTLPVPDASFPCVLCSQVIEHVPIDSPILSELIRTLGPGGRLVLGTPDYANWEWVLTEKLYGFFAPGAYADEHISHYTRAGLIDYFSKRGFAHEATRYILRGELILAFRKQA